MDTRNIRYRILRRLQLQEFLNWSGRRHDGPVSIPLLGQRLGSAVMLYRESWKSDAFRRLASCFPVSMVLDVGANEGQTLVELVKAGLGHVEVLAFEPNPPCAYYLQRLIRLNDWASVTVLPIALSDGPRCLVLELQYENDAGATLVGDLRPGVTPAQRQVVPCFSLDHLIESNTVRVKPNFLLKIDVEGAELEVLRGSRETLRASRPLVMCEVLWAHCEERIEFMRARNAELMAVLRSHEYDVFRLVLAEDQRRLQGVEEVRDFPSGIYGAQNAHQCDYAFVPREWSARLREELAKPGSARA